MQTAVRTLGNTTTRQAAVVVLALVVGIAGIVLFASAAGSNAQRERDINGAAAVFGLGRDVVHVAPGAKVAGTLLLPAEGFASDVSWKLSGGLGPDRVDDTGSGIDFSFVAPASGEVRLVADATIEGTPTRASTTFRVLPPEEFAALNVGTRGSVGIAGGVAVQGESLLPGTRVDTTSGRLQFIARVTTTGSKTGLVSLEGRESRIDTYVVDNRVLTIIEVERDGEFVRMLETEVEHLDGERYVGIQTPDAVAMVKGTRFTTTVGPDGSTIETSKGSVIVVDRFRYYRDLREVDAGMVTTIEPLDGARARTDWAQAVLGGTGGLVQARSAFAPQPADVLLAVEPELTSERVRDLVREAPANIEDPDGTGSTEGPRLQAGDQPGRDEPGPAPATTSPAPLPVSSPLPSAGPTPGDPPPADDGSFSGGTTSPTSTTCRSWERLVDGRCIAHTGDFLLSSATATCGPNHVRWNAGSALCVLRSTLPPRTRAYRPRSHGGTLHGCHRTDVMERFVWGGPGAETFDPPRSASRWCLPMSAGELQLRTASGPYEPFRTTIDSTGSEAYRRNVCLLGTHRYKGTSNVAAGLCVRSSGAPY